MEAASAFGGALDMMNFLNKKRPTWIPGDLRNRLRGGQGLRLLEREDLTSRSLAQP